MRTGLARSPERRHHARAAARRRHAAPAARSAAAARCGARDRRRCGDRRAAVRPRRACRPRATMRIASAAARCRSFVGVPVRRHAVRLSRVSGRGAPRDAAVCARLRDRNRDADQTAPARRPRRKRAGVRRCTTAGAASCGRSATPRAPVSWRCTIDSSNPSSRLPDTGAVPQVGSRRRRAAPLDAARPEQRRSSSARPITACDCCRGPCRTRIGTIGTWLAWTLMRTCRAAVADNLRAIFPDETEASPAAAGARDTFRAYAFDSIDFLRALDAPDDDTTLFDHTSESHELFERLLAEGRGIIVVTGHCGNWEMGSVLMRRTVGRTAHDRRHGRGEPRRQSHPQLDSRASGRRDAGGAAVARYRASDPPAPRRQPDGRHADGPAPRPRSRGGDAPRPARVVSAHAGAAELPDRRAACCRASSIASQPGGSPSISAIRFASRAISRDEAIQRAAQQFADQLGERLRQHPEHWYHFYRYWDAQRDSYEGLD